MQVKIHCMSSVVIIVCHWYMSVRHHCMSSVGSHGFNVNFFLKLNWKEI